MLAEHHRKRNEFGKARAAIEKVLEQGGADITVLRLYAACLEGEGDAAQAAELYRRALTDVAGLATRATLALRPGIAPRGGSGVD